MAKTLDPPVYMVNVSLPASRRWDNLTTQRRIREGAVSLCREIYKSDYAWMPKPVFEALKKLLDLRLRKVGGSSLYDPDVEEWASATGLDLETVRLANLSYELTALYEYLVDMAGGLIEKGERIRERITHLVRRGQRCSSVAFFMPGHGMVHARNMDWPLKGIQRHTILVSFQGSVGPFTAVSVPGMIGVLSGVAKGRFSASINASIDDTLKWKPDFKGWASMLLVRRAFEICQTYDDAVRFLRRARTVVPFFVQVAGPKRGQACIISMRPRMRNSLLKYKGRSLGLTNHDPDSGYEDSSWMEGDEEFETDSCQRLSSIERAVKRKKPKTLKGALGVLRHSPVMNGATQQSLVMCSKTGEVLLNRL